MQTSLIGQHVCFKLRVPRKPDGTPMEGYPETVPCFGTLVALTPEERGPCWRGLIAEETTGEVVAFSTQFGRLRVVPEKRIV